MNDPLGDMLTRIRNAQMRRRPKVSTPSSKLRERVLDVLVDEGYIRGYARVEHKGAPLSSRSSSSIPTASRPFARSSAFPSPAVASTRRCAI